jgi:para-nitrobenzyl esterase
MPARRIGSQPVVDTSSGRVEGRRLDADGGTRPLAVFRGITFARSPVGELRFRPAEPAPPWSGVLAAVEPGPAAPQPAEDPTSSLVPGMHPERTSEACLTLDVWMPAGDRPDGGRPVMVWIHGGAYAIGAGSLPTYDGARLAAEQDVVVVAPNYRLGALGFLYWPDAGVAPNCGLSDIVAALQWVHDNADTFGADPGRITVFGESAGAGAIFHLLAAPSAAGLFRRAIMQSPGVSQIVTPERAATVAECFLARLGGPSRLWTASAEEVVAAQTAAAKELAGAAGSMPFHPVIDGSFVPGSPLAALAEGRAAGVETIIGTTADEMQLFATPGLQRLDHERLIKVLYPVVSWATGHDPGLDAVDGLVSTYARRLAADGGGPAEVWAAILTDGLMRFPAERALGAQARHQARTYGYSFAWRPSGPASHLRAFHAVDLPFTFDTFDREGWAEFLGAGAAARRVSSALRTAWGGFARDGKPGSGWPAWDSRRRSTMVFDDPPAWVDDPLADRRKIWSALWGQGVVKEDLYEQ